jgi:hypothetical protein
MRKPTVESFFRDSFNRIEAQQKQAKAQQVELAALQAEVELRKQAVRELQQ